ncbi:hypothetical protein V6259_09985 [Marinomonas sp. TI.3.20]|uniref:tetratricopeptide repeat protein n=1 Tax=Marinomonas sp. TI.3.20 TaxID=3121296 RepID=UPI00311E7946
MSIKTISLLFTVIFLAGCQENVKKSDPTHVGLTKPEVVKVAKAKQTPVNAKKVVQVTQKKVRTSFEIMTDKLVQLGKQALAANQLLTPVDDNANLYFQAVLGRDPGNYQATLGIASIVDTYTQWALNAARQTNYKAAERYLDSARSVNPEDATINDMAARIRGLKEQRIQAQRQRAARLNASPSETEQQTIQGGSTNTQVNASKTAESQIKAGQYFLPHDLFSLSDDEIVKTLQPIIDKVAKDQSEVAIYWPNDKQARLIYQIINSRVSDYRVRAMIYHRSDYMVELQQN